MQTKIFKKSLIALSCMALLSCGSEEAEALLGSPSLSPESENIITYDKSVTAPLHTPISLDLSNHINGNNVEINSISSDSAEHCYGYVEEMQRVNVEIAKLGQCEYRYLAKNDLGASTQGKLTLFASLESDPFVTTISINKSIEDIQTIDELELDLAALLPAGEIQTAQGGTYILDDDFTLITESKAGSGTISAQKATDLTLSIKPCSENDNNQCITNGENWKTGWHSLTYQLVNLDKTSSLTGNILISIANEINHPPLIEPVRLQSSITFNIGDEPQISIDLSNVDGLSISDPDGQDWQLIEINSMGSALVSLPESADLYNKSFIFETAVPGFHDVSYVISDNQGALSLGVIRIKAKQKFVDYGKDKDWSDLAASAQNLKDNNLQSKCTEVNKNNFTCYQAPSTFKEAPAAQYYDDNGYFVTQWTFAEAKQLCSGDGEAPSALRLPSEDELSDLSDDADSEESDYSKLYQFVLIFDQKIA